MKVYFQLAAVLVLFALVPFVPAWLDRLRSADEPDQKRPPKVFRQTLAQGVQMGLPGTAGIDAIRCRTCTLEKRKKGPLTFGAFNVLRLEGLYVLIPPDARKSHPREQERETSPHEVADRLGIGSSFLRMRGVTQKFSGLAVDSLEVARLDGTNAVTVFTAKHGEARRDGLHLTGCVVFAPTANAVGKAVLRVKPRLKLDWKGGSVDLD